jgi:hypothetical protein
MKKLTAKEFSDKFTKIVVKHLENLPEDEQNKRILSAEKIAKNL